MTNDQDIDVAERRARVLVIDDDDALLRSTQRVLAKLHDVEVTTDAAKAIEDLAAGATYDVILCDLMMPAVTGMDVYDAVLARNADAASRIVFLSGGAFTPRATAFLAAVANRRLDKPIVRAELLALIAEMCRPQ